MTRAKHVGRCDKGFRSQFGNQMEAEFLGQEFLLPYDLHREKLEDESKPTNDL